MKFLAIGHICLDVRLGGYIVGGGAAYSALTARSLGVEAHVLTAFGADFSPHAGVLGGVDVTNVGSPATTIFQNTYTSDGRTQHVLSAAAPVQASPSPGAWQGADVAYLCPIADEVAPDLARRVQAGVVGAAPQGWLRSWGEDGRVRPKRWEHAESVLPHVDLVVLSEEDVSLVSDELPRYRELAPRVVVTRGRRGAIVHEGSRSTEYRGYPANEVDPTGAGDVFSAALLIHWSDSRDIARAVDFANCVASFAVEDIGMRGIPTRDQVMGRWPYPMPPWIDSGPGNQSGASADEPRACDVVVQGLVQGVGYRFFAQEAARRCGVVGTVRNRQDGSVEAHLEGEAEALDRVLTALERGPFGARVDRVRRQPSRVLGREDSLRITY